jgi:hypothetical protein
MMYVSGPIASARRETEMKELQAAPRVDASISRMIEPENICFTVDKEFLDKYPTFRNGIGEADHWAEIDIQTNSSYGNYYSGVGLYLNRNEALSLVSTYHSNFNQTIHSQNTPDGRFTHEYKKFSCGFVYEEKYYQLELSFETLKQVNRDTGFVPVYITKDLIEKQEDSVQDKVTFAPWNNTLVFFNQLPSTMTVELSNMNGAGAEQDLETFTVLPSTMIDLPLAADWTTLDDTTYQYKVKEYPWIRGHVTVSTIYTYGCLTTEIARSLYAQSNFSLKFPFYLPEGFRSVCNAESTDTYMIQIYANQSATDYYTSKGMMHSERNPYPFYLYSSTPQEEVKGIFQVHAMKLYDGDGKEQDARKQLLESYQSMLNQTAQYPLSTPISNPEFIESDENGATSYLIYNQGKFLATVEVAVGSEKYTVVGSLPMEEMMNIAKSLS